VGKSPSAWTASNDAASLENQARHMARIYAGLKHFISDDQGSAAVEYALVALCIGVGIVAALTSYSSTLSSTYNQVGTALTSSSAN
jgi:Flp pilus assembly pilin Flp